MTHSLSLVLTLAAALLGPKLPSTSPVPTVDPSTATPSKPAAGVTTLMSSPTIAQLAKVPEAKLAPGTVLGPDTPLATDASIIFNCASLVQPRFEAILGHVVFHGANSCGGYETGALLWFKAQADKDYMIECAGTQQRWRLLEQNPNGSAQDTTFATATSRPWMHIRPTMAGWHGVQISVPSIATTDSYTLTKCRVTPINP